MLAVSPSPIEPGDNAWRRASELLGHTRVLTALEPGDSAILEHLEAVSGWLNCERELATSAPRSIGADGYAMTTLDEATSNGHADPATRAWDARLARIERRLAEIAETGEQRVAILRDVIADFAAAELAKRDEEIVNLKKQLVDFQQKPEQQAVIDQRVHEISARLEEKQAQRDRGKNGITDGDIIQTVDMVIAQERQSAREEFKAADEEMQRALEAKLAAAEERLKSVPGKLPVSKIWRPECVTYQAEFVCHEGALWQACKDTAQTPGGSDWVCVARAGRDGLTPNARGAFNVYKKYAQLDVNTRMPPTSHAAIIQEFAPAMAGSS